MGLFNFGKKKEKKSETPSCCCNGNSKTFEASESSCCCNGESCKITSIKVLGAGCCHEQYENVKSAIKSMELPVEVEYITDMEKVMTYGAMSMPAIVVNEKIVSMGKVLKAADVEKLLHKLGY